MPTTAIAPISEPDARAASHITVVLADDHPIVRRGVRILLDEAGLELVGEAADVAQARRQVAVHEPDVLLLDLSMPGESSLEAIPGLLEISPRTRPALGRWTRSLTARCR